MSKHSKHLAPGPGVERDRMGARAGSAIDATAPWIADCGDGTYRNPVLFADYSDPDAIRVGEDFWLISSSFTHVPGLPVLHSRDLVNWTLVNHALRRLVPEEHFSQPRHAQGVWAPAIRNHAGKFWIFYPDPDFGIYFVTADDPRGEWSKPHLVKEGRGLIDPCPFWDDDGRAFLIHGWAKSRAGISNLLTLHRLNDDATRVVDEGAVIIDGNKLPGWHTLEGPKLYKREGFYYVFAPAGGVGTGVQTVFRAREIFGPYENRIVLAQGTTNVNGPHQGAWIDTPSGEDWFLHFQEMPAYGRVVHLQPMRWRDGWPAIGRDGAGDTGEPVSTHRKPALPPQPIAAPATSDDFNQPILASQWQWQANPRAEWASLTARPGSLRLACVPRVAPASLWLSGNLLLQKFAAPTFVATTTVRLFPVADGDTAGLVVFAQDYAWLGLRWHEGRLRLVCAQCHGAHEGGMEKEIAFDEASSGVMHLRVAVGSGARCQFLFSADGEKFAAIGDAFQAVSGHWVGAKVGLFAAASPGEPCAGHAYFERFRVARVVAEGVRERA